MFSLSASGQTKALHSIALTLHDKGEALDKVLVPNRAVRFSLQYDGAALERTQGSWLIPPIHSSGMWKRHWNSYRIPIRIAGSNVSARSSSSKQSRCTSAVNAVWYISVDTLRRWLNRLLCLFKLPGTFRR